MSSKLKAAVLGVGYLGTFHAQKLKAHPDVELVGVYDFHKPQADKVSADLQVKAFSSAAEAIKNVDYVHIPASTKAHYELATMALESGKHVLVEKPIAATYEEGEKMVQLAAKKNLKLAVGHIERFNPSYVEVHKMNLKPQTLQLTRRGSFKPRGSDVSVLHDLMIHDLDLLFWLTGSEIADYQVSGSSLVTDTLDSAVLSAKMKNGVHAVIDVSRTMTAGYRGLRAITKDFVLNVDSGIHQFEKIECDQKNTSQKVSSWTLDKKDSLQLETDDFVQSLLNNKAPKVSGSMGLQVLSWIERFEKEI